MDSGRPSSSSGELPAMEKPDWRNQLPPQSREKMVNKVIELLKRRYIISDPKGMQDLHNLAAKFEDKIYNVASSQADYVKKISMKLMSMEFKSIPLPNNINSPDPALQGMQSNNSAQLLPATSNQSQALLGQNNVNNGGVVSTGLQGSSSSLLQNGNSTNVNVQNPNMQNISGVSQNPNVYANSQRQQARQQQQPQSSQQQYLYQQQQFQQQQLMKQKFSNISPFQQQQMMMSKPNNHVNMQQHMVQQNNSNMMQQSQSQQSQSQQMVSNIQSQQMNLQQQQPNNRIQSQNLTDQQNGGDWQEEVFQKIRILKETYYLELTEMYKSVCARIQHHESLSQVPKSEQYHKLRPLKHMIERFISFLQLQKHLIQPSMKEKLAQYEKQMVEFIGQHIRRRQLSLHPTHMQQQQQSQSQPQVHHNQMNPQITMNLQNNSKTSSPGVVQNHPQMMNSLQETNPSSLHQQNPNFLIKQEQQQMMQTQEMKQQQFQQRQMHPQFIQKQKLLQQQISDGSNFNNDAKMRQQQMGNVKLQFQQQQIKQGSPFSNSSPQFLQPSGSPQISQQPSPQNVNSPFIAPSPIPGESDKVNSGASSLLSNNNNNNIVQNQQQTPEHPLDRLLKAVSSMSKQAISGAISEIGSVITATDRIAGSEPGSRSKSAVGEDLFGTIRNFTSHDGSNTKRMKRYTSVMPFDTSDLVYKNSRRKAEYEIAEEIREINQRLIDTVVELSVPTAADEVAIDGQEGTVVKCSFSGVTCGQLSPFPPLRLLIPTNYPESSPVFLDNFPDEAREHEDLSVKAKSRFNVTLRGLSEPITLGEIARTWDICAREVIREYAEQNGGGSFSSNYGNWENCMSAA